MKVKIEDVDMKKFNLLANIFSILASYPLLKYFCVIGINAIIRKYSYLLVQP